MKNLFSALFVVSALSIHSETLHSNEINQVSNEVDEIIVNSSYIDSTLSDLDDPIHIISGNNVLLDSTLSLGESLRWLIGNLIYRFWIRCWPANNSRYVW